MPEKFILKSESKSSNKKFIYPLIALILVAIIITPLLMLPIRQLQRQKRLEDIRKNAVTPQEMETRVQSTTWDYQKHEINSTILAVDTQQETLQLHVSWPPTVPFIDNDIWVRLGCQDDDILIVETDTANGSGKPLKRVGTKAEMFSLAQKNDYFFGLCSDVFCEVINKKCELQHHK